MTSELPYKELGQTALHPDSVWITLIATAAILIIGFTRTRSTTFIHQMLSLTTSTFNWHAVENAISLQERWTCRILYGVFFISISLVIYEITVSSGAADTIPIQGMALYATILAACIAFYLFQFIMRSIVGYAFDIPQTMHNVWICKILAADIFSIISLPIIIIFPFTPETNYTILTTIAIITITLMYIWRLLHSFRIITTDFLSLFYTILYLCAVEAIPMLCIAKTITQGIA